MDTCDSTATCMCLSVHVHVMDMRTHYPYNMHRVGGAHNNFTIMEQLTKRRKIRDTAKITCVES